MRKVRAPVRAANQWKNPMDSWELSKIAGAILLALLAIVLPKTLLDMRAENAGHSGDHASVGYTLPGSEVAAAPAKADAKTAAAPAAQGAAPVMAVAAGAAAPAPAPAAAGNIYDAVKPLLAAAKPEAGAATFKGCAACHSPDKGGANKVGPAMWGIVGRSQGAAEGFNYSAGLKGKGGNWTAENLVAFLNNPKGYIAGTKMVYAGITDPEKLADLLAYLNTLSDSPAPLPKS
jgi:cytochrome c